MLSSEPLSLSASGRSRHARTRQYAVGSARRFVDPKEVPIGSSYCDVAPGHPQHGPYHEEEYGFPVREDRALFERLSLEINQAGLSWLTILKKKDAFREAFEGFDIARVARYGERERRRLLSDAGIIRNRLKVDAVIENARRILEIQRTHGSFARWLDTHHPRSREEWRLLFRDTFRFTGGEIVGEFLLSTGYLEGAHRAGCPAGARVLAAKPPWLPKKRSASVSRRKP